MFKFIKNRNKRKYEKILAYILKQYNYYNAKYIQATLCESKFEYYLACASAYLDIYEYINKIK